MMLIYTFGFVIPFLYNNISTKYLNINEEGFTTPLSTFQNIVKIIVYLIASITQGYFAYLEFIDYKYSGSEDYFKTIKNKFDFAQPFLFIIHILFKILFFF